MPEDFKHSCIIPIVAMSYIVVEVKMGMKEEEKYRV
jgi:hypothetical protein